jgi:hypothetical protein
VNDLPRRIEEAIFQRQIPEADADPARMVTVEVVRGLNWDDPRMSVSAFYARPLVAGGIDGGIGLMPYASVASGLKFELAPELTLEALLEARSDIAVVLRPQQSPTVVRAGDAASGSVGLRLVYQDPDNPTLTLLQLADAIQLTANNLTFAVTASGDVSSGDVGIEVGLHGGKLSITPNPDSFLGSVLPKDLAINVDLGLGLSKSRGLYWTGGAGLEVDRPVHASLGPFELERIRAKLYVDGQHFSAAATVSGTGTLGPVSAAVDGIGLGVTIGLQRGDHGPISHSVSFIAPTGVGIALESDAVTGGGFLLVKDGQYSGALELAVYDIAVQAYGLIDTNPPGGGYSFLIALSVEFSPAIQLGYGFMLTGLGGLLGINRTVDADVLQKTVRNGSADRLLFPTDLVKNGPRIIKDVSALFPSCQGHYVVGPMAKLTWLELITGKLGLFIEFPGPRIVLLGTVQVALPDPDDAIVELNVDVAGILDFPKKHLAIDASLRDSVIGKYPISGDMAVRLDWGDKPNFALSVGGLNPAYQAPAGFPKLKRVTVDLAGKNSKPSISLCGYFAITSNSVQLGAKAEVKASGCGIDLHGWVEFDALFVLSPFSFTATLDAGVKISFHGYGPSVHLHGELSGPSPYHVRGRVSVSILWWDASLSFEKTFGSGSPAVLPDKTGADLLNEVVAEIAKPASWSSTLPANAYVPVRLVPDTDTKTRKLDPVSDAVLCQRAAPLGRQISMWKGVKLASPVQLILDPASSATLGDDEKSKLALLRDVQDAFAPGQYFTMTNSQKLSAQPFERMKAGAVYRHQAETGDSGQGNLDYDEYKLTLGTGGVSGPVDGGPPTTDEMEAWSERSDSATSAVRTSTSEKYVAPNYSSGTTVDQDIYVVCDAATQKVQTNLTPDPVSKTAALLALDRYCTNTPADRTKYVVIQTEV